jgi:NTE family protein
MRPLRQTRPDKTINLALQGGGAHGAFAWGVVDRLLDESDIGFEGLSGTSAGAVNAVVLAHGLMNGGTKRRPGGAGRFLAPLLGGRHVFSPLHPMPELSLPGMETIRSATFSMFDTLTRTFSPYEFNPFDINPLRDLLSECVDFERIARALRRQAVPERHQCQDRAGQGFQDR